MKRVRTERHFTPSHPMPMSQLITIKSPASTSVFVIAPVAQRGPLRFDYRGAINEAFEHRLYRESTVAPTSVHHQVPAAKWRMNKSNALIQLPPSVRIKLDARFLTVQRRGQCSPVMPSGKQLMRIT